jgi:hypothetical protein
MFTPGTLIISSLNAQLLRNTEKFGKMDPYVNVAIGRNVQTTSVAHKGHFTPSWATELGFRFKGDHPIFFEVWDHNNGRKNDFIGAGAFSVPDLKAYSKHNVTVNLYCDGMDAGQLFVNFDFFPDGGRTGMAQTSQIPAQAGLVPAMEPATMQTTSYYPYNHPTHEGLQHEIPQERLRDDLVQSRYIQDERRFLAYEPTRQATTERFDIVKANEDPLFRERVERGEYDRERLEKELGGYKSAEHVYGGSRVLDRPEWERTGEPNWKDRLDREKERLGQEFGKDTTDVAWGNTHVNTGARPVETGVTGVRYST